MLYQTNVMLVGGEPTYADQFRLKALKHGIKLNILHHIHWDQTRKSFPTSDLQVVIVLKDICNHKLRDWASAEAKKHGVKFCEISQKISIGIARLRQTLGMEDTPVELLEDDATLNFQDNEMHLASMHGIIEESIEILLPKNKLVLNSKKKYLTHLTRQFCEHIISESTPHEADERIRNNPRKVKMYTFDAYVELREKYVSTLKKKTSGFAEVEELAKTVIIAMSIREDEWTIFDIKRTLSFALGYTLTKKQEGEIKYMRKRNKEEINSDVKTIVDLILSNPVDIMGLHDNEATRRQHVADFLDMEISEDDFVKITEIIHEASRDRKGRNALKGEVIKARETWSRHYLDLRKAGEDSMTKSEFVACHKSTWGSRISDKLRKEYFPPVVEEVSHTPSVAVQEMIAKRNEAIEEVQVEEIPVEEVQVEEIPVEEVQVEEEVAQSIATVLIGNLEVELNGTLSIKEISVGTQLKVLSGEKKITIESFDGNSLRGVTIC